MKSDRRAPVAIIGAGFSGTITAAQLARRGIRSLLVEYADRAGLGIAYSTREPVHLLNVPAGNMSAWPDRPGDFAQVAGDGECFAERRVFAGYMRDKLAEAVASGGTELVKARAVAAQRREDGWQIALEGGETIDAEALVLATGNQTPQKLRGIEAAGERLIGDPWNERAREAIEAAARDGSGVLILGNSLTMVDTALSLDAAGHRGSILALSRRGLIPRAHDAYEPAPVDLDQIPSGSTRGLARWLRRRSAEVGWRAAVDALRPHSQALWQALSASDKQRFLRHARPWWDVHRHRIAPAVSKRLRELIDEGRLEIGAGRVTGTEADPDGVLVSIRRRGRTSADEKRRFAFIFNCTGPLGEIGRTREPLLRQMLDEGLIAPDEAGIGIAVDDRARPCGSQRLWALGTLTKGRYWEIIAVPDIRDQAAAVAEDIARELQA